MYQARRARATGDLQRAESLIGEVDVFALRMADGSGTKIEKLIALAISKSANKRLADLLASSARPQDARRVALRLDEIERSVKGMRPRGDPGGRSGGEQAFRREAMLLQGFGLLAVLAGLAAFCCWRCGLGGCEMRKHAGGERCAGWRTMLQRRCSLPSVRF